MAKLQPDVYVRSIYDIDLNMLKKRSISCLIMDIDNTLTPWNSSEISDKLWNWVQKAHGEGFRICLLSNNGQKRVKELSAKLGVAYIYNAAKPRRRSYQRALDIMDTTYEHAAVIGDQLLTDILGGKRMGMFTILVDPIDEREFIGTKVMRWIEGVLFRRHPFKNEETRS